MMLIIIIIIVLIVLIVIAAVIYKMSKKVCHLRQQCPISSSIVCFGMLRIRILEEFSLASRSMLNQPDVRCLSMQSEAPPKYPSKGVSEARATENPMYDVPQTISNPAYDEGADGGYLDVENAGDDEEETTGFE